MSLYPVLNNNLSNKKTDNNIIFLARVKDILLVKDSKLFNKTDGWSSIGDISFSPLYKSVDISNNELIASPLFSNIKQLPLKEELILILIGPSNKLNNNPNSKKFYYLPFPINIWNSIHHNSIPDITKYNQINNDIIFGDNFKEIENIRNLTPEEGDLIIEGRFGNSIRLSSSIGKNNPWKSIKPEKPILIIKNGNTQYEDSPWNPIYEDINNDDSSIYLTSGQDIPINISSKNLKTFEITISNGFNSSLIIPDNNV